MTTEPKIVTVTNQPISVQERNGIFWLLRRLDGPPSDAFDRPNAMALRDALTAVLDKGEG